MLRIWYRFCQQSRRCFVDWPAKKSGFTGTLRESLADLGWDEMPEKLWERVYNGTGDTFTLDASERSFCTDHELLQHKSHHSWRFTRFEQWKQSCRRDTETCIETDFDIDRLKLLQKEFSILMNLPL